MDERQSQDKNGLIIMLQNELANIMADMLDKHGISERDMYLVIQGVYLRVSEMTITRMCYFDASQDEIMRKLIKNQKGDTDGSNKGNSGNEE